LSGSQIHSCRSAAHLSVGGGWPFRGASSSRTITRQTGLKPTLLSCACHLPRRDARHEISKTAGRHTTIHYYYPGPNRQNDFQTQYCNIDSAPRRRAVPIQDLHNPSVEEKNTHCPYPAPSWTASNAMTGVSRYHANNIPNGGQRPAQGRAHRSPRRSPPGPSSSRYQGMRREHRPTYSEEETLFIWYHRIDLGYDWADISNAYNAQFPDRRREDVGGIQCRYYRCCQDNNIPKVREPRRSASSAEEYGMRARTGLWYPWMRE